MTQTENFEKIEVSNTYQPTKTIHLKLCKDGTLYEIIAMLYPKGYMNGYSCITDKAAMLIIAGYEKTAYAFRLNSYISWDYVYEKLCKNGSQTDAKNLTILIHEAQRLLKEA